MDVKKLQFQWILSLDEDKNTVAAVQKLNTCWLQVDAGG